jgi:hypothetical protein
VHYERLDEAFRYYVPSYKSAQHRQLVFGFDWDRSIANFMWTISERRCMSRINNYVIPGEFARSRGAIRFGNKKEGHGYHGERGDFCMVGAALEAKRLTVFYRRLELIGGLHYDLAVFREIEDHVGPFKTVTIMAAGAMVFALKGNSNEKLYQRLTKFYEDRW